MNYLAQFDKDPLRLSNERILWEECEWAAKGSGYVLARKERSPTGQVIPAEVRLIGEISDEGYRLFADGGWDGRYDDGIEKAKASAQLSIGRIPEVDVLWPKFIESLNEIVMARGPARPGRQFPLVKYGNVKIRHKIFEVRTIIFHVFSLLTKLLDVQKLGSMTPKAFPAVSSTPSFQLDPKDISTPINTPTIQSATLGPAGQSYSDGFGISSYSPIV